jgi:hypothetical protein
MPFNASEFYTNPIAQVLACYTDALGMIFYAVILLVVMAIVLLETESWPAASAIGIFIAFVCALILPSYILVIFLVVGAFSFAAMVIDALFLG